MTQPTKREQLAAMRLEDFKAHLRTIAGGSSEQSAAQHDRIRCWCAIAASQREARRNADAEIILDEFSSGAVVVRSQTYPKYSFVTIGLTKIRYRRRVASQVRLGN
jgi:hypothetical protein